MTEHVHDVIPMFVNGRLAPDEVRAVEAHVRSCTSCRADVDSWRAVAGAIGVERPAAAAAEPADALDLDASIAVGRERGDGVEARAADSTWRRRRRLLVAVAAATAAMSLGTVLALVARNTDNDGEVGVPAADDPTTPSAVAVRASTAWSEAPLRRFAFRAETTSVGGEPSVATGSGLLAPTAASVTVAGNPNVGDVVIDGDTVALGRNGDWQVSDTARSAWMFDPAAIGEALRVAADGTGAIEATLLGGDRWSVDTTTGRGDLVEVVVDGSSGSASTITVSTTGGTVWTIDVEVALPDVTLPEITLPAVAIPDVTIPDVTRPDVTRPDVAAPDVTIPDVTVSDVVAPEVSAADVSVPDVTPSSPERPPIFD